MAQSYRRVVRLKKAGLGGILTDALNVGGAFFGDPGFGSQVELASGLVSGASGGSVADQARQTRVNVYLIGAKAGIVDSARLVLGLSQEPAPQKLVAWAQQAISVIQAQRPDVWQAAAEAGPLHDEGNDAGTGLSYLAAHHIGIGNLPYAGTNDGHTDSQSIFTMATQLKAFPPGNGDIPVGGIVAAGKGGQSYQSSGVLGGLIPATLTGTIGQSGIPVWAGLALVGAVLYVMIKKKG